MKVLKLESITHKAKNRLTLLKQQAPAWDETWKVTRTESKVLFSNKVGPWLFVEPSVDSKRLREYHSRWVHAVSDEDFTLVEVK